ARERPPAARGVAEVLRGRDRARAAVREVSGRRRKADRDPGEGRAGRARHQAVFLGAGRGRVSGFDLQAYLAERRGLVDAALERHLPSEAAPPLTIHRAMRYSVMAGGKRLRPILVIAGAEAVGGAATMVMPTACALEMIHTYSLIHDDLPAMDDDDYRRGRLTNHKVFGDAIAILAGDALLTLAFRLIADNADLVSDPRVIRDVVAELADAAGTVGMVGGQVVDSESEGKRTRAETLEYIHRHKTAALMRASLRVGALPAGGAAKAVAVAGEAGGGPGPAVAVGEQTPGGGGGPLRPRQS